MLLRPGRMTVQPQRPLKKSGCCIHWMLGIPSVMLIDQDVSRPAGDFQETYQYP
jgi:hypothetical protein